MQSGGASSTPAEPCGLAHWQLQRLADEELMAHLKAGHHDALTVLFDRYHRLVLSIGLKLLRDMAEAQDLTQEVFLDIFRTVAHFDAAKGTSKMWLLRCAYRRALNRREYLKLRMAGMHPEMTDLADGGSLPFNGLEAGEARRLVRQVLARLDVAQKNTLELAYFEGLSMKEIAAKTGQSVENVRHHYYRGLSKLRTYLLQGSAKQKLATSPQEAVEA